MYFYFYFFFFFLIKQYVIESYKCFKIIDDLEYSSLMAIRNNLTLSPSNFT